jgi:hypothetical protein
MTTPSTPSSGADDSPHNSNTRLGVGFYSPEARTNINRRVPRVLPRFPCSSYVQPSVRNLDNFLIMLIQKLFDMMMTYTQIDNLNVTHSKHAYLNEL